mgnify:FL=1
MSLKEQLTEDMKAAMRAGEKFKLGVIRFVNAAIKQREVDERITLDDTAVLAIIEKQIKQRRETMAQLAQMGREAGDEADEIAVLQTYLTAQLTADEVNALTTEAMNTLGVQAGAAAPSDMGKVMGWLKPKIQGRCDPSAVSAAVKAKLAG